MVDTFQDVRDRLEKTPGIVKVVLPPHLRAPIIYSSCRCHIENGYGQSACFGVGSFPGVVAWEYFVGTAGHVLDIGNYTEIGDHVRIITGGEHRNKEPINLSMKFSSYYSQELLKTREERYPLTKGPVIIGDNVVIGTGAIILSGVIIGDGAVIGAGAVVTKDIPCFAIVAGNPAQVISNRRRPQQAWWNLKISSIGKRWEQVKTDSLPADIPPEEYIKMTNYLVLTRSKGSHTIGIKGVLCGERFIPYSDLPEEFKFFFHQLSVAAEEPIYMIPDIFEFAGLTN